MKKERFLLKLKGSAGKRGLLLAMLLVTAVILSSCYVEQDRFLNDGDGLNAGSGGQQFDTVITPTPSTPPATATPTPNTGDLNDFFNTWNLDGDAATTAPPNVIPVGPTTPPIGATAQPGTTATPIPQSTISGTASSNVLRSGSSGAEVTNLQNRLKELGYYNGSADGQYGNGTVNAVKAFQEANNLQADGVAGNATQRAVYSFSAVRASATTNTSATARPSTATARPTTRPTTSPTTAPIDSKGRTDIYLRLGDSGAQVKILQNRLIVLGYLSGTADSRFEETTDVAVKAFQKNNSLYNDGVAGPDTLAKLYSTSAKKASAVVSHIGALRRGMNGGAVRSLQQQLKNLGYYTGSVDGDYGTGTETAVMAFQSAHGLTADGVAGTATMNAIYSGGSSSGSGSGGSSSGSGGSSSGGSSSNPVNYASNANINGYSTISATSGSSSSNVINLQSVLRSRNYYSGSLDGSYGGGTTDAVRNYQQAAGLRVTGMATPATQRLLFGGSAETGTYSKLDLGSSGSAVERLQFTLYELMYYDGNITGRYDEGTRSAVLLFQQVNGLAVDGVAGEATQRRLFSSNAIPCNI